MSQDQKGSIKALVPRGLITNSGESFRGKANAEGLCPVHIGWENGKIVFVEAIDKDPFKPQRLLLPRLVEPHAHLDKAFTWATFSNLKGTYTGALEKNLKELPTRTFEKVRDRAHRGLKLGLKHGLRAIRTHVDSFGAGAEQSWEAMLDLQREWKSLIELQLVALAPLEYWSTSEGQNFGRKVAVNGGLIGGVVLPPFKAKALKAVLREALDFANKLGCGIDLHIDESQGYPAAGLIHLLDVLDYMDSRVPITCSHASSMSLLSDREVRSLGDRLAKHGVNVVALPLTNSWLLGRKPRKTPIERPLAPIFQLQQSGVIVALGGDNVQDPWFPLGNFDPIALMGFSLPLAHLAPWQRLGLAPFTTSPAFLMNLKWDGTIQKGKPADFIFLNASNWSEALSTPPVREVMVGGLWINGEQTISSDMDFGA